MYDHSVVSLENPCSLSLSCTALLSVLTVQMLLITAGQIMLLKAEKSTSPTFYYPERGGG